MKTSKKQTSASLKKNMEKLAGKARDACRVLASLDSKKKNEVLCAMGSALLDHMGLILEANRKDVEAAQKKRLSKSFIERLTLDERRICEMAESLGEVSKLDDPVGVPIKAWARPNGLQISKVRVPIGVILVIYEARPNVTSDCAGLCFKSGNAVILKGGSDAIRSNEAIFNVLQREIVRAGLPSGTISFVETADRRAVDVLLQMDRYINLVMPRGGESLIREVRDKSRIPVIKHYKGVCHIFVDASADVAMAKNIVMNAKVQRPSVCNAVETLLVHQDIAEGFLPMMVQALQDAGVEVRGCSRTRRVMPNIRRAVEADWYAEYLDLILSVKVVKDVREAIDHINHYGSSHSDAIVTQDQQNAELFLKDVDSACVYVNASTRFTDGYQFGLGAEIGISTDRLHARGPMGLEELTTYKYVIRGTGQVRE
ncbi:MAG: glutamate-5-semialdehyde dehydrogenase [Candidatus Omnitrophica bacterium]|nr:glutamate-5-semialdehyde dehydrogenase [Candidatus Omnitrophota bacterium]MDD5575004.1 glutamate-5-semialdehyde dehydrogenase [Candidatus Omnitrophota bacterium]